MTETASARITALYRYPVKGLSAQPLTDAQLTAGQHFPGDRLFAIENGPSGFDPANPEHQPKQKFLVLARQAALAKLKTRYDDASHTLAIVADDVEVARGDLTTSEGRAAIEAFFRTFLAQELTGAPKVLEGPPGFRFMDSRSGFVSIINLASLRALETETGVAIDPIRFRANVYVDGIPAFSEFGWVGRRITIGEVALTGLKRTERCAAAHAERIRVAQGVTKQRLVARTHHGEARATHRPHRARRPGSLAWAHCPARH